MPFAIEKARRKATSLAKKYIVGTVLEDPVKSLYEAIRSHEPDKIEAEILEIFDQTIKPGSNCVDVGCHKGFFLRHMLRLSPMGDHFAFEPIPRLYRKLEREFSAERVRIFPYALSSSAGLSSFHFNRDNPAFSGFLRRKYLSAEDRVDIVEVEVRTLDSIIPDDISIDLMKIDVEGAELQVLAGASRTLERSHPVIVFEFGTGSAEYYGTTPNDMYSLLTSYGYDLFTLSGFLSRGARLTRRDFENVYFENIHFDFVAFPDDAARQHALA
jgi:FkbM family methyltransferase